MKQQKNINCIKWCAGNLSRPLNHSAGQTSKRVYLLILYGRRNYWDNNFRYNPHSKSFSKPIRDLRSTTKTLVGIII